MENKSKRGRKEIDPAEKIKVVQVMAKTKHIDTLTYSKCQTIGSNAIEAAYMRKIQGEDLNKIVEESKKTFDGEKFKK